MPRLAPTHVAARLLAGLLTPALVACGPAVTPPVGSFAIAGDAPRLGLLAVTAPAWPADVRPDAPWVPLDTARPGQEAGAFHLKAEAAKAGGGRPDARTLTYRDGVAFTLRLVEAATAGMLDGDATDGEATLGLPPGVREGLVKGPDAQDAALDVVLPRFFRRDTLAQARDGGPWYSLGAHAVPWPWREAIGDDEVRFTAHDLKAFELVWRVAVSPDTPPLPPACAGLEVPPEAIAGAPVTYRVTPDGRWPQPPDLTTHWRRSDPDGRPTLHDTDGLDWAEDAPPEPGCHQVAATIETAYFRVQAPAPARMAVRRELLLDTFGPMATPRADDARAQVTDGWPLPRGVAFALQVEGTMNPWGAPDFAYCGFAEPVPMYPSPDRPVGAVATDAAFFFAYPNFGQCRTAPIQPVRLFATSLDGGATWVSPAPQRNVYQPSHRYDYPALVGAGQPLRARIMDYRVWDNYGQLKLTIRRACE